MGFLIMGLLKWTICSLPSQFCAPDFQTFSLSCWDTNSYYPRKKKAENGKGSLKEMDGQEGFQCLGHTNYVDHSYTFEHTFK